MSDFWSTVMVAVVAVLMVLCLAMVAFLGSKPRGRR